MSRDALVAVKLAWVSSSTVPRQLRRQQGDRCVFMVPHADGGRPDRWRRSFTTSGSPCSRLIAEHPSNPFGKSFSGIDLPHGRGLRITNIHHRAKDSVIGSLVQVGDRVVPGPHYLTLGAVDFSRKDVKFFQFT